MFKKLVCVFLTAVLMVTTFSGCGKQVETAKVAKAASVANFAAYKQDVVALLDKEKVNYEFSEFSAGNEEGTAETAPYIYIIKIKLNTEPGGEINIGFTNKEQIESFIVSIVINHEKIEDCGLNIRDYSYLRNIYNLVSELKVSALTCNRLIRKTNNGIAKEYASNPDAFYKKNETYFSRDKTKTWVLQYTIYYETAKNPTVFEETLTYKGNLAPR